MTLAVPELLASLAILASLSVALAIPQVRDKLVGGSNLRNALVPLVAGALLWMVVAGSDLVKARIEESTIPADVLSLRIQNVEFGMPTIPESYLDSDPTQKQVKEILRPLSDDEDVLEISEEDFEQLNEIASESGMIVSIDKNRKHTAKDVANAVADCIAYTFNYKDWAKVASAWSSLLVRTDQERGKDDKTIHRFAGAVSLQLTAAGLFQGVVGMANRGTLSIPEAKEKDTCLKTPNGVVEVREIDDDVVLDFPDFQSIIHRGGNSPRRMAALRLGNLMRLSCFTELSAVLKEASELFKREAGLMTKYVNTWNKVIANNRPQGIRITASISNVGRFDSFVRTNGKVSVGPLHSQNPLAFIVSSVEEPRAEESGHDKHPEKARNFLHIPSRSNLVVTLRARLTKELQTKLYGAYQSGQGFLRLGVLASSGASEEQILSQVAPFSSQAKVVFDKMVDDMNVPLSN
jgi:hypothetical protein